VVCVQRLSARARLDEHSGAIAHAQAEAVAGDESWARWVEEYQRGEALVVCIELTLAYSDDEPRELRSCTRGVFVESDLHAPKVEQQIAELVAGDLADLAEELVVRGYELDVDELGEMYVHVELDLELRERLERARTPLSAGT
jgi:hypothetical protein